MDSSEFFHGFKGVLFTFFVVVSPAKRPCNDSIISRARPALLTANVRSLPLFVHAVIRQEGFSFNPREITPPLLRRHRLTDLHEMAQHHGLAIGAQPRFFR